MLEFGVTNRLKCFSKKPYGFTTCTFVVMNLLPMCDWILVVILFLYWIIFWIALKQTCCLNNLCEPFFNKLNSQNFMLRDVFFYYNNTYRERKIAKDILWLFLSKYQWRPKVLRHLRSWYLMDTTRLILFLSHLIVSS